MFDFFLREEAAASRNKRQQLDHLLRMAAPHERLVLLGIGVVLLALAAWILFGSIVRSITVDGILIESGQRHEIVSTEPGHLIEFLVARGGRVAAGDPVARQSVPELDREAAVLRSRIELLEAGAGESAALRSALASAQTALMRIEARRTARGLIVSHVAGEVMALRAAAGEYLPPGAAVVQVRETRGRALQAVLRVAPQVARRIKPGMRAAVEGTAPDGAPYRRAGEVAQVAPGPLPRWLAAVPPASASSLHRVDIVLDRASDWAVPDGAPCRVRIVLGEHSFATLFEFDRI